MLNPVQQQDDALGYSFAKERRTSFKWIFLIMSLHKSQGHTLKSQPGKEACWEGLGDIMRAGRVLHAYPDPAASSAALCPVPQIWGHHSTLVML